MRTKTLVVLAGLTLAAGAGAFYAAQQRNAPDASAAMQNQPVLPGLAARIDGLSRVEIERGGVAFALQRSADGNWSLPGKSDYPVAFEPVRRLALDMASLRILEARTANPALHGEIDLDGAGADQKATRVTLFGPNNQPLASLLVGRTRFGRQGTAGDGTFVRLADQNQVWLAQGRVAVEREAALGRHCARTHRFGPRRRCRRHGARGFARETGRRRFCDCRPSRRQEDQVAFRRQSRGECA